MPQLRKDGSTDLLDLAHGLIVAEGRSPADVLHDLARAVGGTGAGLARCGTWSPVFSHPHDLAYPWADDPSLPARLGEQRGPIRLPNGLAALAPSLDGSPWLAWVETPKEIDDAGLAAFGVAALALGRAADADRSWADLATRLAQQQAMEVSADLTRRLAHDFGNILCGILGFTELALGQQIPTSAPLHNYLHEIYRAAQAGSAFTQQLQAFSRRHGMAARPCPPSVAFAALEPRFQAVRDAKASIHLDLPTDLPPVALDPDALQQVLGALIDNAREALAGPGAVSVSACAVTLDEAGCRDLLGSARPGPHVEFTVADTGMGLSPDAQKRLFTEPFFSTKPRRKGFGLAVAYGILHAHKGGLRLYPGAERGAVARVVVPVGSALPQPILRPVPQQAKGDRLLVVDDDREVLNYVTTSLEQAGYRVQPFDRGEPALESYFAAQASDPFALVVTDVVMPGIGGVEMVRRLVRRDPPARVLFMSGQVNADFMRQDFAHHRFQLLDKPFRLEQLLEAVRTNLGRTKLRSQNAEFRMKADSRKQKTET